ncbi:NAD-dependent epimerase/dehydratase family protein [Halorubrum vacuolatum]|uniref:L-threonine 3-dehydrogenase n=1 Tax=Halorubrum vacuolatum TaxID=63740 RepID=A0A238YNZ4_HALVU|nr:NAD-dependent epimerase/dehydratase family protein [Halorubrum vacuolatum]SNR72528.1 L-threonine 3-dehydrogenase [Halorubrum vacuolatum]
MLLPSHSYEYGCRGLKLDSLGLKLHLVTGAAGQIGSELTPYLDSHSDFEFVLGTDLKESFPALDRYEQLDVTDRTNVNSVLERHEIDIIFHLAALLSATGEHRPQSAYNVNLNGLYTVLEAARQTDVERVVVPSSIAFFGQHTPPIPSERAIYSPTTMYGVSKAFFELLGEYYNNRYDMDVRGLRLPGVISHKTKPEGGTTDYAVEVFYEAIESGSYTYFVREDTRLPFVYMPDVIDALIAIAQADSDSLNHPCSYNIEGCSFTARELTAAIRDHIPHFDADYDPDSRQKIADTWPETVDDSAAHHDWSWNPKYGLEELCSDMIMELERQQIA